VSSAHGTRFEVRIPLPDRRVRKPVTAERGTQ
jgi:hypothetical protein